MIHVLDQELTLTRVGLGFKDGDYCSSLAWSDSRSLSHFEILKELLQLKSPHTEISMTDSTIAFKGKLISLETGQRIIKDHEKTQIVVEPSILFKITTDTITCVSNPNSRELFIGDAGFK